MDPHFAYLNNKGVGLYDIQNITNRHTLLALLPVLEVGRYGTVCHTGTLLHICFHTVTSVEKLNGLFIFVIKKIKQ
jgi:hypothetical protein